MKAESDKNEVLLATNTFNKPAELSGVNAWSQLVLNLLNTNPGSYPSVPELGIGLHSYEYEYMDDIIPELRNKIKSQVATYLEGVPLVEVECKKVFSEDENPKPILLIILTFEDATGYTNTAIAASIKGNKILDFEISWE